MDRQRTLLQMTQKMSAAIAAEDWQTLAALNTLMQSTLPQMASQGEWNVAERAALSALRQMHEESVKRCKLAAEEVQRQMQDMQAKQEGWMAYALHSEHDDIGTQA